MPYRALTPARPRGRSRLVVAALWLVLAAMAALTLWHLRHDSVAGQGRELSLLSIACTDAVERGLRDAEDGLHTVVAELRGGRLPVGEDDARQALRTRADLIPLVHDLWVLDAQGQVVAASTAAAAPALEGFLPAPSSLAEGATAISRAAPDAALDGEAFALALRRPDGGWVVATLPSDGLLGSLGAALPGADARVLVLRPDAAPLAAVNASPAFVAEGAAAAQAGASGPQPTLHRLADGSSHLVEVRAVPRFGLRVVVSRGLEAELAAWRQAAQLAAAALAALGLVMGAGVVVVERADRRHDEAQAALLAQASRAGKLESLGTLAGGVAHDFNNVLAGIVGYGEMAQEAAVPGSAQARHLDNMLQAALRGKALVERILAFSRGGARSSTVFELAPVVEEVLALLAASLRSGIVLERQVDAPGARLKGDPTQAFQAVMNLCTNAMQAMPDGGMLSVHLSRLQTDRPRVLSHTRLAPGRYLVLAVSDQGGGITPQVMDHLFEPFFTTRAAQSGTGLGLAVVFGVVAEFGGAVDVQSRPGEGARFTLYLPECPDAAARGQAAPAAAGRGDGQRVLVVDDEPQLVALTVECLQGLGYAPEGFDDAAQALQAVQAEPGRYAAVVTDEVMPGLTGTELTQALRAHAPALPVLLISGYGGALLAQRAQAAGVSRVLAKPLQRWQLAQALAEVLQAR